MDGIVRGRVVDVANRTLLQVFEKFENDNDTSFSSKTMTILLDSADAMRDLARGSWIETHRTLCVKTLLSYRARIFGSFSSDSARDLYEDPPELPRKNQAGVPCKLHYFQEQLARFTSGLQSVAL